MVPSAPRRGQPELRGQWSRACDPLQGADVVVQTLAALRNRLHASPAARTHARLCRLGYPPAARAGTGQQHQRSGNSLCGAVDRVPRCADRSWGEGRAQVYDNSFAVSEHALLALEEACADDDCLDTLIQLRPQYDHLGETALPVLLRLLARPSGFAYLRSTGFVERVRQRRLRRPAGCPAPPACQKLTAAAADVTGAHTLLSAWPGCPPAGTRVLVTLGQRRIRAARGRIARTSAGAARQHKRRQRAGAAHNTRHARARFRRRGPRRHVAASLFRGARRDRTRHSRTSTPRP